MTPKEQEWICEIAALNSASNTVTIAKICWKEIRRLRISQLRRMADLIDEKTREWGRILDGVPKEYRMEGSWRRRWMRRMRALRTACLAEIERLRGMG